LQQAAWDANSSQDDSIPFVAAAQNELDDRQNKALLQNKLKSKRRDLIASDEVPTVISKPEEKEAPAENYSNSWNEPAKYDAAVPPSDQNPQPKEWEQEMEELKATMKPQNSGGPSLRQSQSLDKDPNDLKQKQQKQEKPGVDISEEFYYIYQGN
jgi:hypothetical protein